MSVFAQGLEVTGIGMLLVFLSLLLVAGLIWALNKVFPGRVEPDVEEEPEVEVPVRAAEVTLAGPGPADMAAVIAVALARQGLGAATARTTVVPMQRAFVAMPWERPADLWGDDLLQGETVTVLNVDPDSGNWKSQGRLASL
jgi:Na+-transporting methylmalonyl-CoA/oxaloacetate decarboxylase gamma subunit